MSAHGYNAAAFADAIRLEFGDDDELVRDMLEAETNFDAMVSALIRADAEAKAYADANKALAQTYRDRAAVMAARSEAVRGALHRLMQSVGFRKISVTEATVSVRAVPPKVIAEDVSEIPSDFVAWRPTANLTAIKAALEAGQDVPGCSMSAPGETISIRRA